MQRADFLPISPRSHFRQQLSAIGHRIEEGIGHELFALDAVIGPDSRVLGVFAGKVDEVERASWPLAERRTNVILDEDPVDVVVFGLPTDFHYGPGMGRNPILATQAIAATILRVAGVLRPGGVAVVAAAIDQFFGDWFPSFRETFDRWADFRCVAEMSAVAEELSTRTAYVDAYRAGEGYHPFHAFSMLAMGEVGRNFTSAIYVAGAPSPAAVRAMGLEPVASVEDGLRLAERQVGRRPRVLALPGFLTIVPPHLFARS